MTAKESLLWGEEFSLPVNDTEKLLDKINSPKKVSSTKKISSKLSLEDKMAVIESNVMAILGKHKDDTEVIRDRDELHRYISKCIENGVLALDTETNNSLDPLTCLIMGACLYTPNEKQAYVPIHHVNRVTNERLPNQLTENDLKEEFSRVVEAKVKVIYHNASFDIRVIRHTCGIDVPHYWDTMIASQILNENEAASLKEQYMLHVDKDHGKYDIEHLFEKESYAIFDPELFALYSATDALMTYQLYSYQLHEFEKKENERIYNLLMNVEFPCLRVVMEMEDCGIEVDLDYASRLGVKYHKILDDYDKPIMDEMSKLRPLIENWRKTKDAQTLIGNKTKSEQLEDPINLESPTQLAILIYDVLKIPPINRKKPRSTDKNTIPQILEERDVPILRILLERKTFKTLVNNFIDKIPDYVNKKDGRVHCSFNQVGAATGRFSCSNPNLQQIPSKNHEIRMMFKASTNYHQVEEDDDCFKVSKIDEICVNDEWVSSKLVKVGDTIKTDDGDILTIIDAQEFDDYVLLHTKCNTVLQK